MLRRPAPRVGVSLAVIVIVAAAGLAACGGSATVAPSPSPTAVASATVADVQALLAPGCASIAGGDGGTWARATAEVAGSARASLHAVAAALAPLAVRDLRAVATPTPGRRGWFDVRFVGALGGAGPPDRRLAERVLIVTRAAGGWRVTGDATPAEVARQGLTAFHRPQEMRATGCVLVYDSAWRVRAAELLPLAAAARARVASVYGVSETSRIVFLLFSSRAEVATYLGRPIGLLDARVSFFSRPAPRLSVNVWHPLDVCLIAPALAGVEGRIGEMIVHETAHAVTSGWVPPGGRSVIFLEEGVAVAAESGRDYGILRDDLADGGPTLPLLQTMAAGILWSGQDLATVRLAYAEAGATVRFILERWDVSGLRRFVRALAEAPDLSAESIEAAARDAFGVPWAEFQRGWLAYCKTVR